MPIIIPNRSSVICNLCIPREQQRVTSLRNNSGYKNLSAPTVEICTHWSRGMSRNCSLGISPKRISCRRVILSSLLLCWRRADLNERRGFSNSLKLIRREGIDKKLMRGFHRLFLDFKSLLCPGKNLAFGSINDLILLTAMAASPNPVAISFSFPGKVAISPAA